MSEKRSKWIAKLVRNKDVNLFITVRNYCGKKTEMMSSKELYKEAKKLWKRKVKETESWRKKENGKND